MIKIFDNDNLITKSDDKVYIYLECGYGQPSVTAVYLKKNTGTTQLLKFENNTEEPLVIGKIEDLKYNEIEVHTVIQDAQDNPVELEDISLYIEVFDIRSNKVDTGFTRKTKGMGTIVHSFYTVSIY
jgi:hypothetical protein